MITSIELSQIIMFVSGVGAIWGGLLVIGSTNPVHSIFALVMTFAFTSILLMMEGAEFLSLLFIIVYVGAIAILFRFVVMMLNIRLVELMDNTTRYVPIGFLIGITFLGQLMLVNNNQNVRIRQGLATPWQIDTHIEEIGRVSNIKNIGEFLYTEGWKYFMVAGIILLIAMIGAIVLTLHHASDIQRQDVFAQVTAKVEEELYTTDLRTQ